ncbi:hypothetical protein [Salinispira pacifica]
MNRSVVVAGIFCLCLCLFVAACGGGSGRGSSSGGSASGGSQQAGPASRSAGTQGAASGGAGSGSPSGSGAAASPGPARITVGPQSENEGASQSATGGTGRSGGTKGQPAAGTGGAGTAGNASGGQRLPAAEFTGREDEYLMTSGLNGRVVPDDSRIGPLQNRYVTDAETRSIYRLVDRFLAALAADRVEAEAILPDNRPFVLRRMSADLSAGHLPESWRIGQILFPDDLTAHLRVLIAGNPGSAAGDIYVEKSAGQWYISGVQVDFTLLAAAPAAGKPVEPGTPIWMNNAQ